MYLECICFTVNRVPLSSNNFWFQPLVVSCFCFLITCYSLIPYQAGVSPLLQHQFEEMVKQNGTVQNTGDNKRRKLAAIGQDLTEPLQALRTGGQQVM